MNGLFSGVFGALLALFIIVLVVIWILLPFAIVAIQKRVTEQLEVDKQILNELKKLNRGVSSISNTDN